MFVLSYMGKDGNCKLKRVTVLFGFIKVRTNFRVVFLTPYFLDMSSVFCRFCRRGILNYDLKTIGLLIRGK